MKYLLLELMRLQNSPVTKITKVWNTAKRTVNFADEFIVTDFSSAFGRSQDLAAARNDTCRKNEGQGVWKGNEAPCG